MPEIATIVDDYIAMWNEADAGARREIIARTWTEDATYVDPLMTGTGHDGLTEMVAAARQQFPGHTFHLSFGPDAHNDHVRFAWRLVADEGGTTAAEGVDFALVAGDGRLRDVVGFLEQPAGTTH
jgi:SnoaL-like domain